MISTTSLKTARTALVAATAASLLSAGAASATTITIDSVSGIWQNTTALREGTPHAYPTGVPGLASPAPGTTWDSYDPSDGEGSNRIEWGWEYTDGPSAYVFNAAPTPFAVPDPTPGSEATYVLGEFVHENRTIVTGGPRLLTAELNLSISGAIGSTSFNYDQIFNFDHNETPNAGTGGICPEGGTPSVGGVGGCPDVVTLSENVTQSNTFVVDGITYRVLLEGFVISGTDTPALFFFTEEEQDNPAIIRWKIERDPTAVVPLPAGLWLMLAGLGSFLAVRRRSRA